MAKIEYDEDQQPNSLGSRVFTRLQNDILDGKYIAGDNLIETKLSSELGVSRTPIREAIRQLELEGLVKLIPNKGAVVKGLSVQDVKDIYAIRILIEGLAAKWAAEKITEEELEVLKETVDLEEFYTLKGDTEHVIKMDTRFHEKLFRASKSIPLIHTLSTFHHYLQKVRADNIRKPGRASETLEEHKKILQAIIDGNGELAEKYTTEHVRNASINLMD